MLEEKREKEIMAEKIARLEKELAQEREKNTEQQFKFEQDSKEAASKRG